MTYKELSEKIEKERYVIFKDESLEEKYLFFMSSNNIIYFMPFYSRKGWGSTIGRSLNDDILRKKFFNSEELTHEDSDSRMMISDVFSWVRFKEEISV